MPSPCPQIALAASFVDTFVALSVFIRWDIIGNGVCCFSEEKIKAKESKMHGSLLKIKFAIVEQGLKRG